MQVGQTVFKRGFFTKALYLRGVSSTEIENRIGYRSGRLSQGWHLLFLERMPNADDFEVRGYSHMSGGVPMGHLKSPPDPRNSEQRLRDDGHDLRKFKKSLIEGTFSLHGPDRLAKVIPVAGEFGANDYPPGSGIPQWTLIKDLPFRFIGTVNSGEKYLGNYTW